MLTDNQKIWVLSVFMEGQDPTGLGGRGFYTQDVPGVYRELGHDPARLFKDLVTEARLGTARQHVNGREKGRLLTRYGWLESALVTARTNPPERSLLAKAKKGDRRSLEALISGLNHKKLLGTAKKLVGDPIAAQDVLQISLEKALLALQNGQYDPDKGPLQAWVATILRREAANYLRVEQRGGVTLSRGDFSALEAQGLATREGRRLTRLSPVGGSEDIGGRAEFDEDYPLHGRIKGPYEALHDKERQVLLRQALSTLRPVHLFVLEVFYATDPTKAALAKVRGMTPDNQRQTLRRARAALQQAYRVALLMGDLDRPRRANPAPSGHKARIERILQGMRKRAFGRARGNPAGYPASAAPGKGGRVLIRPVVRGPDGKKRRPRIYLPPDAPLVLAAKQSRAGREKAQVRGANRLRSRAEVSPLPAEDGPVFDLISVEEVFADDE